MKCKRTLVEETSYEVQLAALGDVKRLDELLRALTWALHENAEHFEIIPGTKRLRVAKTDAIDGAPALRIFFTIETTTVGVEEVHQWFIEADGDIDDEATGEE